MDLIFDFYNTLAEVRTDEQRDLTWSPVVGFYRERGMAASVAHVRRLYGEFWRRRLDRLDAEGRFAYPELDGALVFKDIALVYGGRLDDGEAAEVYRIMREASILTLRPFDGAAELLSELRAGGNRLFLLSNAQRAFTRGEIERCGFSDAFDGMLLSSECGVRKPDPEFFRMLFDKYCIDGKNAVMIGDEKINDIGGAAAVGIRSVWAEGGAAAHAAEIAELVGNENQ